MGEMGVNFEDWMGVGERRRKQDEILTRHTY